MIILQMVEFCLEIDIRTWSGSGSSACSKCRFLGSCNKWARDNSSTGNVMDQLLKNLYLGTEILQIRSLIMTTRTWLQYRGNIALTMTDLDPLVSSRT